MTLEHPSTLQWDSWWQRYNINRDRRERDCSVLINARSSTNAATQLYPGWSPGFATVSILASIMWACTKPLASFFIIYLRRKKFDLGCLVSDVAWYRVSFTQNISSPCDTLPTSSRPLSQLRKFMTGFPVCTAWVLLACRCPKYPDKALNLYHTHNFIRDPA